MDPVIKERRNLIEHALQLSAGHFPEVPADEVIDIFINFITRWSDVKSNYPEREIKRAIFMGSGCWSAIECNRLLLRLNKCFSDLSGLQQMGCGPSCVTPEEYENENDKYDEKFKQVIQDIAMGLMEDKVLFQSDMKSFNCPECQALITQHAPNYCPSCGRRLTKTGT